MQRTNPHHSHTHYNYFTQPPLPPPPSPQSPPKSSHPEQTSIPGHEIFLHLGHSRGSGGQVHILVDGEAERGARDVQAARVAVVQAPTLPTGVCAVGQALAGAPAPNGRGSFRETERGVLQVHGADHLCPGFALVTHLLLTHRHQSVELLPSHNILNFLHLLLLRYSLHPHLGYGYCSTM